MISEQLKRLEADLWNAADNLRANSGLKSSEYATPILGLIFLKFADNKYRAEETAIRAEYDKYRDTRAPRELPEIAVARCGFYLPPYARYDFLASLPESENIAGALKKAMESIEEYTTSLKDCLPKDGYFALAGREKNDNSVLKRLLQKFSDIPSDADGDLFGQIYEYFLSRFALAEGQGGGEFFTPRSVVCLMVEIIEPHRGRVLDPACGSGGMFVQSARFIAERRKHGGADSIDDLFVCGQEKTAETVRLARMNLAVNGLRGEIRQGNSYKAAESWDTVGAFDYVLANPPFNVDEVQVADVLDDPRFKTFGIPRNKGKSARTTRAGADAPDRDKETVPNANYLWIGLFAAALKPQGRAALVMANSASDAGNTEAEIRQRLIQHNLIYGMLSLPSNMFYTVTLPATLWFFDRGKTSDRVLFIDARRVFTQIDRAHREFSEDQVLNIALISCLNRGERHRYLARIDDCLHRGRERADGCRADFADVWQAIDDALPPIALDTLDLEPVAQAAEEVRFAAAIVADLWVDGRGPHLNEQTPSLLQTPLAPDADDATLDTRNRAQQAVVGEWTDCLRDVQTEMKTLDRNLRDYEKALTLKAEGEGKRRPLDRALRDAKAAWDRYTAQVQDAVAPLGHAHWLQARFPDAQYADVVGLCKLATPDEIAEQDYSLNPGRYVGVVIEEDGKTEDEFRADLRAMHAELETLNADASKLAATISHNVLQMVGPE